MKTSVLRLPNKMLAIACARLAHVQHTQHAQKIACAKQAFEVPFFPFKPMTILCAKNNISSFFLTYIQTIYISFENCFVLYTKFTQKDILRKRIKSLFLSNHDCKNNIFIFSLWFCYYFKFYHKLLFFKKAIFWCSIEIIRYSRLEYEVFVFPGSRPQFAFDGPDSNLYIEAPALNLYLPASPLNLYLPAPSQQFVFTGPG